VLIVVHRLETTLQATQQESTVALTRRLDMEKTLLETQKEVRTREERIADLYEQLRVAQDAQRRAEIAAEVAKGSETRLVTQLAEAREETKRHVSLVEHINRIESGLQGRAEAEKEALAAENQSLKASYDSVRKQLDDRTLLDEQRAKVHDEEVRSLRSRLEQKTAELAGLTEELTRAQLTAQAAQERSNLLERQLTLAQERLTQTQGSQIVESSMAGDYSAKELALERAMAEVEALRAQLASTEVHAEQFRKISAANESALKELRARAAAAQEEQETVVARMREEVEAAQREAIEHRTNSQTLLQDAEEARAQLRTASAEAAERARALEEALALAQQECEQLKVQHASTAGEIAKFQDAARISHQNYERELQLHATAERELTELRRQVDEMKSSLQTEQQRSAQLSAECIRKEAQVPSPTSFATALHVYLTSCFRRYSWLMNARAPSRSQRTPVSTSPVCSTPTTCCTPRCSPTGCRSSACTSSGCCSLVSPAPSPIRVPPQCR
jgi:chromosome segregation ATPase